jgi:1-acyl-sn-glycerol-3-phosphate acyltransferase
MSQTVAISPDLNAPLPHPTRRNWVWFSIQVLLRLVFMYWLRYRVRGLERLPKDGGCLFLINHQSYLDPLLVGLPLTRPVSYVARDSLFPIPIVGSILRATYVFPINRDSPSTKTIKEAVRRVNHGFFVGLFPEGTRGRGVNLREIKPGFVALVRRIKAPVYPVGIAGADEAMPRHTLLLRPKKVRVVFGEPFTPDEIKELCRKGNEAEFARIARERIGNLVQEAEDWRKKTESACG